MIETAIEIVIGALLGWLVSHWYYKKQERSNPAPLIKEMGEKIQEIYSLASVKNNKELQSKLNELMQIVSITNHRVKQLILPLAIDSQGLSEVHKSGDKDSFQSYLNEVTPHLLKFHERVRGVDFELNSLREKIRSLNSND